MIFCWEKEFSVVVQLSVSLLLIKCNCWLHFTKLRKFMTYLIHHVHIIITSVSIRCMHNVYNDITCSCMHDTHVGLIASFTWKYPHSVVGYFYSLLQARKFSPVCRVLFCIYLYLYGWIRAVATCRFNTGCIVKSPFPFFSLTFGTCGRVMIVVLCEWVSFPTYAMCGFRWKHFVQKFWWHLLITSAFLAYWQTLNGQNRQRWLLLKMNWVYVGLAIGAIIHLTHHWLNLSCLCLASWFVCTCALSVVIM